MHGFNNFTHVLSTSNDNKTTLCIVHIKLSSTCTIHGSRMRGILFWTVDQRQMDSYFVLLLFTNKYLIYYRNLDGPVHTMTGMEHSNHTDGTHSHKQVQKYFTKFLVSNEFLNQENFCSTKDYLGKIVHYIGYS